MDTPRKKIIIIVGTNASGKSGLAVRLAQQFAGEVISADSRQVYIGLDIATGKITSEEMQGVPHHLLDVVSPTVRYTAADFARDGHAALAGIWERKHVPIVAGGTGFYIQALIEPESLANVAPNEELRAELEALPADELFERLTKLDPKRAAMLTANNEQTNVRRLVRAVEVASTSSAKASSLPAPVQGEPLDILWLGIHWEKDELEERIRERTLARIDDGMIEEAERLHASGVSYERMEELGLEYKHLADYLRKRITKEELVENIVVGDRQYAKRQRTWFKRNPDIQWFTKETLGEIEGVVGGFLKG